MAIALAFLGAILVAFLPIFIRIVEHSLSPNSTIFNRFWIATVIMVTWSLFTLLSDPQKPIITQNIYPKKLLIILMIVSISFVGTQVLWAWSIDQTTVANSEVLHCLSPGFATLASWLFFQQKFSSKFVIGVGITTLGTIVIGYSDMHHQMNFSGDGLALLSALLWGIYLMAIERLRNYLSTTWIVLWTSASCTVLCLPIIIITGDQLLPQSREAWLTLILLAITTVVFHSLTAYLLKWLSSVLMATIFLLSPVVTAVIGFALFSESLSLLNLLGFAAILVGIYLVLPNTTELKTTVD